VCRTKLGAGQISSLVGRASPRAEPLASSVVKNSVLHRSSP
jgi:hypothetical protein